MRSVNRESKTNKRRFKSLTIWRTTKTKLDREVKYWISSKIGEDRLRIINLDYILTRMMNNMETMRTTNNREI